MCTYACANSFVVVGGLNIFLKLFFFFFLLKLDHLSHLI